MKSLADHLSGYAAYHRDRRNIATHLVGIPMIVLAIEILLSRPVLGVGGLSVTPAMLVSALAALFYLALDRRFGLLMTLLLAAAAWGGLAVARLDTGAWLAIGIGLFVAGWAMQFLGHAFEGRKPAFLDDLAGLIVGPLFVVAELAFALGWRADLARQVDPRR